MVEGILHGDDVTVQPLAEDALIGVTEASQSLDAPREIQLPRVPSLRQLRKDFQGGTVQVYNRRWRVTQYVFLTAHLLNVVFSPRTDTQSNYELWT